MQKLLTFLPRLWANGITLFGAVLTTLSGFGIFIAAILEAISARSNPYLSGVLIVSLPLLFVLGLFIIPLGFYLQRRRRQKQAKQGLSTEPDPITQAFTLALNDRRSRRLIAFVGLLTVLNVMLFSIGGHQAATYMDTQRFCGTSCHTQMQPEWTAYQRSAHNQVACVECHIGPGTSALVEAKLNGLSQLIGTMTGKYHRPVPAPIAHRRGSEATCEGCHARSRYIGDRVHMYPHYKPDKTNTPVFNVTLSHVGGLDVRTGKYSGIHAHMAPNHIVRYEFLDVKRTRIGKITVIEDGKLKAIYQCPDGNPQEPPLGEQVMDCIDCHNRPTHRFDGTARQAVDRAMFEGRLDAKQPYLAKVAADVLDQADVARDGAAAHFKTAIPAAYAALDTRPLAEEMDKSIRSVTEIYLRNVFPEMKVRWQTYPDLDGHYTESGEDHIGCLRCHDGKHMAKLPDGKSKTMDKSCDLCHDALATEKAPEKFDDALKQILGIPLD